jgi:hypothetical protein
LIDAGAPLTDRLTSGTVGIDLLLGAFVAGLAFIVVIGGIGRMEGPLIGTIVFFLLRGCFADLGPWYLMLLGASAITITLTMPKGIAGLLADQFDLDLFPLRRRVRPPETEERKFGSMWFKDDRNTLEGIGATS